MSFPLPRLRTAALVSLALAAGGRLAAQDPSVPLWSADQLDQLLAPVALYPDPLLAVILPAATDPTDVVLAARAVEGGGGPAQPAGQDWDGSILALMHFPVVLEWMSQNIPWTAELGQAFGNQPRDVEEAIQRLRARARAAGTLVDTPQQQVVVVDGDIEILPVEADVLYVPNYNPALVYGSPDYIPPGPFITFGAGFSVGHWLNYQLDWARHGIWVAEGRPAGATATVRPVESRRWSPPADRPSGPFEVPSGPAVRVGNQAGLPPRPLLPRPYIAGRGERGPPPSPRPPGSAPPPGQRPPPPSRGTSNSTDPRDR